MASRQNPLDSGTTTSGGSADPISGQFSKIRSLIGAASPTSVATAPAGTSSSPFGVPSTPPLAAGGPTAGFAAGANSSDILRQGINLTGGQGVDLSTVGGGLLGQGVNMLNLPANYYQKLLSGDPTTITQALAPTAAALAPQTQNLIQTATNNMPRGGFAASTVAEAPFAEQAKLNEAAYGQIPGAATGAAGLGSTVAGLGQGEQQLGLQALQQIINASLGKMGVTTGITGNLANVGSFLQGII